MLPANCPFHPLLQNMARLRNLRVFTSTMSSPLIISRACANDVFRAAANIARTTRSLRRLIDADSLSAEVETLVLSLQKPGGSGEIHTDMKTGVKRGAAARPTAAPPELPTAVSLNAKEDLGERNSVPHLHSSGSWSDLASGGMLLSAASGSTYQVKPPLSSLYSID
jgi:hypothetical protein